MNNLYYYKKYIKYKKKYLQFGGNKYTIIELYFDKRATQYYNFNRMSCESKLKFGLTKKALGFINYDYIGNMIYNYLDNIICMNNNSKITDISNHYIDNNIFISDHDPIHVSLKLNNNDINITSINLQGLCAKYENNNVKYENKELEKNFNLLFNKDYIKNNSIIVCQEIITADIILEDGDTKYNDITAKAYNNITNLFQEINKNLSGSYDNGYSAIFYDNTKYTLYHTIKIKREGKKRKYSNAYFFNIKGTKIYFYVVNIHLKASPFRITTNFSSLYTEHIYELYNIIKEIFNYMSYNRYPIFFCGDFNDNNNKKELLENAYKLYNEQKDKRKFEYYIDALKKLRQEQEQEDKKEQEQEQEDKKEQEQEQEDKKEQEQEQPQQPQQPQEEKQEDINNEIINSMYRNRRNLINLLNEANTNTTQDGKYFFPNLDLLKLSNDFIIKNNNFLCNILNMKISDNLFYINLWKNKQGIMKRRETDSIEYLSLKIVTDSLLSNKYNKQRFDYNANQIFGFIFIDTKNFFYNDIIINLILNEISRQNEIQQNIIHLYDFFTCSDGNYSIFELTDLKLTDYLKERIAEEISKATITKSLSDAYKILFKLYDDIINKIYNILKILKTDEYRFIHGNLTCDNIFVSFDDNGEIIIKIANFENSSIFWNEIHFSNDGNFKYDRDISIFNESFMGIINNKTYNFPEFNLELDEKKKDYNKLYKLGVNKTGYFSNFHICTSECKDNICNSNPYSFLNQIKNKSSC